MTKNKICVIFTGGTIGSDSNGKTVALSGSSRKMMIDMYEKTAGKGVEFDMLSPINILSENVQQNDLEKLYSTVKGLNTEPYDGIIITHGTDTLCFTVNWFSQVFCNAEKPIVFVSSLYPLTDERSNGLKNFQGAVTFIEKAGLPGVYCSFANDNENCKIHLGSRLIYPDEINGFYRSALNSHFAEIDGGGVIYNRSPFVPSTDKVKNNSSAPLPHALNSEVMLITMRSLLNFSVYGFDRVKPKAVIIELSHSGTVCTEGEELNFKKFTAYCKAAGVPVVIAPVMSRAGVYSSMSELPEGVCVAYDLTIEMTVVKVMAALGSSLSPDAFLNEDRAFEKIPFPRV